MIWIILGLFVLLAAWVGVGLLLLAKDSRRQGVGYTRKIDGRVYSVGDTIEVALELTAPTNVGLAEDNDVILAIDHSGSMGGGPGSPMREALRAAENFVRRLPASINIGIVGFDHDAQLLCPFTPDHRRALQAITAISSGGGTAIHTALNCSYEAFRDGRPNVGKTVILLSDGASEHASATAAANSLHTSVPPIALICIGFGPNVDEELMRSISTGGNRYMHVEKPTDLYNLFGYLAAAVSGQIAVSGLVDEGTLSPDPFRLASTGALYPVGIQPENPTRVVWSVPLMDGAPVSLTYNLVGVCPGWRPVASPDSKTSWRMPDGSETKSFGPRGPRVLVMPRWLGWAWPILNPLFWMLFGKFWPCPTSATKATDVPEVEPLPRPTLPPLLPAPEGRLYEPQIKPAVVIGLGEVGEWTVCRLKQRLRDREIDPSRVNLLTIHVTHSANRKPIKVRGTVLDSDDQIDLHQDLRPYLESLRRVGAPATRAWVPWRTWLAEMRPLTTSRTINDRRKARLALLQNPDPVEQRLSSCLRRVIDEDGVVVLTGAAGDAECSGLLAEVAHICAEKGTGVTVVFAPSGFERLPVSVPALAQELERMTLMSGKHIFSDRHQPLVWARKLFDRIIVLEQQSETAEQASLPAAELIWNMLAFEEVSKSLPSVRSDGDRVMCCGAVVAGHALPAASLWKWVREHTLAVGINGHHLSLKEKNGKLILPMPDRQAVNADVEAFWTGSNCTRPQNSLLRHSRAMLQTGNSDHLSALLALQDQLPVNSPYHEQVGYSERERQLFTGYVEEWSQYILDSKQNDGRWGIHRLMASVLRIEVDFKIVVSGINRLSGNDDFAGLVKFAGAMFTDFLAVVSNLRKDLSDWLVVLVGPQLDWHIEATLPGQLPVCCDIEKKRQASKEELFVPDHARETLDRRFDEWYHTYGDLILSQLQFRSVVESYGRRLGIRLTYLDQELKPQDDLANTLRSVLDQYRNVVLSRPLDQWIKPEPIARPLDYFRVGKYSKLLYPTVEKSENEDDPFTAAAIQVQERPLKSALGVESALLTNLPHTWPEEANAERIMQKIRNRLRFNPQPFNSVAVQLMRDTGTLWGFFNDFARGNVIQQGSRFILKRAGHDYEIGRSSENLQSLDAFQSVFQQVVSLELSVDGEPIPPPELSSLHTCDEILKAVESHPLCRSAVTLPNWRMWQDIIRGLCLEHNNHNSDSPV